MLRRIAIYCVAFLGVWFLVAGYYWFKARQVRAESAKALEPFLAEEMAQKNALESLGTVNLNPADLSLASLQDKLHEPALRQPGARNTTRLGWACGSRRCAIWASFLASFGQEIPPTMTAAALVVHEPAFENFHHLIIGGIYPGETVAEMEESCRKRGYGLSMGKNKMSWDADWNFVWADTNGRVGFLAFTNERMMREAADHGHVK
jgi:hypothetical protein